MSAEPLLIAAIDLADAVRDDLARERYEAVDRRIDAYNDLIADCRALRPADPVFEEQPVMLDPVLRLAAGAPGTPQGPPPFWALERLAGHLDRLVERLETVVAQTRPRASASGAVTAEPATIVQAVREALREGGGAHVELRPLIPPAADLAKTVAAFAGCGGGTLVLGVARDGQAVGLSGVGDASEQRTAREQVERAAAQLVQPRAEVHATFVNWLERRLLLLRVPAGGAPLYTVNGRPYVRHGAFTLPATTDEIARRVERASRGHAPASGPPPEATG